jgi:hypothetical protein
MNKTTRLRVVAASALVLLASGPIPREAHAQSENEAAARVLFNQGRDLMKAGKLQEACGKLEAARKLYASPGVLLNLADCHEQIDRTASAWTEFGDAADAAQRANRPRDEAEAKRRQAAIQSRLSLLAVMVDHAPDNAVLKRDGTAIDRSAWGTAVPVDPGMHEVTMEAPGYRAWSTQVTVRDPGKTETVRIPALESVAPVAAAPPPPEATPAPAPGVGPLTAPSAPAAPGSAQRIAGWTVGGIGVAAMAASGVLAIVARSKYSSAVDEGAGRNSDSIAAGQLADAATWTLIAGGVVAVTGVVLVFTAPKAQVTVGTTGTTLVLSGQF